MLAEVPSKFLQGDSQWGLLDGRVNTGAYQGACLFWGSVQERWRSQEAM